MSNSEPNPERCHVTLLPLHIVRPGRFPKTNPLIAGKESEKHQLEIFCADSLNTSHLLLIYSEAQWGKHIRHTMHLVAFDKAVFLFVNSSRSSGEGRNVFIQVPAQIFIKHSGQEMELFIIVFLCEGSKKVRKKTKWKSTTQCDYISEHCKVSNYDQDREICPLLLKSIQFNGCAFWLTKLNSKTKLYMSASLRFLACTPFFRVPGRQTSSGPTSPELVSLTGSTPE